MSETYAPTAADHTSYTIPTDGDLENAVAINSPTQDLADMVALLRAMTIPDIRRGSLTSWAITTTPTSCKNIYLVTAGSSSLETIHLQLNEPDLANYNPMVFISILAFGNEGSQLWIRSDNDPPSTYPTILAFDNPRAILVWENNTWQPLGLNL
jgi:hypothetical protein